MINSDLEREEFWRLQQLCPANPGWCAVFEADGRRWTLPVACWSLAMWETHYWPKKRWADKPVKIAEHKMVSVGLVPTDLGLVAAQELDYFVGYCGPDDDPETWLREEPDCMSPPDQPAPSQPSTTAP